MKNENQGGKKGGGDLTINFVYRETLWLESNPNELEGRGLSHINKLMILYSHSF